jgi:hypothetical protein
VHRKLIISPEFDELPLKAQTVLLHHTSIHQKLAAENQQSAGADATLREFVDLDKLYPLLSRTEQMDVLQKLGIKADPTAQVAGLPSAEMLIQNKTKILELAQKNEEAKRSAKKDKSDAV